MVAGEEQDGSDVDARFLLANERTLLAWNRTGLALVAAGIAVVRLLDPGKLEGARKVLGLVLVVGGAALTALAYRRYRAVDEAMRNGDGTIPGTSLPLMVTAVVLGAGATGAFIVLF